MKKTLASAGVALLIAGTAILGTTTAANATPSDVCVPSAAWTETIVVSEAIPEIPAIPGTPEVAEVSTKDYQRYSWTGGPTKGAPSETPPSGNWQANTTNYAGAGHGTDPVGTPFSKNPYGNGDWFFWTMTTTITTPYQAAVPEVPAVPGTPAVIETVNHPAVECEDPKVDPPVVGVATYTPTSSATCEAATFSHPAVDKPGLGVGELTYSINGGVEAPYTAGEELVVEFGDATVVEFRIFSRYSPTFKHQFGVSKVFQAECADPEPVVPVKPAPVTVFGEWTVGSFDCDDTTVVESRTVTNVGHRLEENVWVLDPQPSDRSKTETLTRDLTDEEIASLECVVPTPEPTEPVVEPTPEPTEPVVEPVDNDKKATEVRKDVASSLAETGSEYSSAPMIWFGSAVALGGALFLTISGIRRRVINN